MDHKTKIKTIKNQPRFFTQSRNDPVQVILWLIMQRFSSLEKCKTLRNVEGRRKKRMIRKEKENDYKKMDGMAMRTWLKNLKDQVGDREKKIYAINKLKWQNNQLHFSLANCTNPILMINSESHINSESPSIE